MSQKRNIDEYFKEGLTGYKIQPSSEVWQNIEKSFWKPIWFYNRWILIGIAAMLLLLIGFAGWYFSEPEISNDPVESFQKEANGYKNTTTPIDVIEKAESTGKLEIFDKNETPVNQVDKKDGTKNETFEFLSTKVDENGEQIILPKRSIAETVEVTSNSEDFSGSIFSDIGYMQGLSISIENEINDVVLDSVRENLMAEYRKKLKRSHFYTGLYFTPAMMYYPSVKDQFVWTAGLDFGMTFKKFYVETSIAYQKIKEQGIYTIDFRTFDSVGYYNQVESFEVNPSNSNEILYNTKEVTVYDSIDHYTHVVPVFTYDYINIPLNFGYKVFRKDAFTVAVETGVTFTKMVDKQIPVVDFSKPEYNVVQIKNETPERVDFNFRWQLAVRLDMNIVKAMSVSVKPVFTKYINSIYDTQSGYPNVKPYSMGIQLGVYYGF